MRLRRRGWATPPPYIELFGRVRLAPEVVRELRSRDNVDDLDRVLSEATALAVECPACDGTGSHRVFDLHDRDIGLPCSRCGGTGVEFVR
jgi:excinuclease UvrABC ATPase subunit